MFEIRAYYGQDHNGHGLGLEGSYSVDFFEVMAYIAHDKVSHGYVVEVKCVKTGKVLELDPDSYFENFEGECPVSAEYFD